LRLGAVRCWSSNRQQLRTQRRARVSELFGVTKRGPKVAIGFMKEGSSSWGGRLTAWFFLVGLLASFGLAQAQPTITGTAPVNGATGVSPATTIVFTFSVAMNPGATTATFFDDGANLYSVIPSWNPGNTVLTCTPVASFPANTKITWFVSGQSATGQQIGGTPVGSFTTAGGAALLLTNAIFAPAYFSFDVLCSPSQPVTVEYRTNLVAGQWQTLLTTNSPGNSFRAVVPQATTNRALFFRARSGI
jgi:hypothetical protein